MSELQLKLTSVALALGLSLACAGDDAGQAPETETTGDGDGDGDPGDGDGDPGDGDGDPGDGDGEAMPGCTWSWEATQMQVNGKTKAALDVDVAPNGEFVAVGRTENSTNDAWIGRFTPNGEPLWEQTIDSGGPDYAAAITFDQAGDVIVVGSMQDSMYADLWIQKRGADGSEGWTVEVASEFAGDNTPGDVALAPDGSIVVSGAIRAANQDTDIWVRKLSTVDGSESWTATYSGEADENGFSIDRGGPAAVAADGTIYVSGEEGVNFETREAVLLAWGPDGGQESWKLSPRADGMTHLHDAGPVAVGPDGEAYFSIGATVISSVFWLYRVAPEGDVEWELTEADFMSALTSGWTITGLDASGDDLMVSGNFLGEEEGQGISWSEVWVAHVDFAGRGRCIDSHTWQNVHIIPASTFARGSCVGSNGTVAVGEIIDGPENYLWVGGFE